MEVINPITDPWCCYINGVPWIPSIYSLYGIAMDRSTMEFVMGMMVDHLNNLTGIIVNKGNHPQMGLNSE